MMEWVYFTCRFVSNEERDLRVELCVHILRAPALFATSSSSRRRTLMSKYIFWKQLIRDLSSWIYPFIQFSHYWGMWSKATTLTRLKLILRIQYNIGGDIGVHIVEVAQKIVFWKLTKWNKASRWCGSK